MVKPDPGLRFPAQQGLLGLGRTLQQFAPHRRGNSLVQTIALRGGANADKDGGDPFRIPDRIRILFEAGDMHDLPLARSHEPHQNAVDPVDSRAPRRKFACAHGAGLSPMARAPAAPCR